MTQRTLVTGQVADRYVLDRRTLIAAAAAIALAQAALAMPAVLNGLFQDDLGTSASQLTWISAAFLVPVTLFELTFGMLGDLFGRKRLLIIGTIVLGIGQLIGFLTPGADVDTSIRVAVLLVGQVLTGVGAAAIMPTTLAMVAAGTHTAHDRARAISVWAAALATGSFVSPVLGGFLARYPFAGTDTAGWRWGFLAVAVLAVPCLIVTLTMATTSSAPTGRSLDWPGQITVAISLFALLYAVIQGSTTGYGAPDIIGAFVVAALSAVAFIIVERRASCTGAAVTSGPVRQPAVQRRGDRHRAGQFRVARHRLHHQHQIGGHPGVFALGDVDRVRHPQRHDPAHRTAGRPPAGPPQRAMAHGGWFRSDRDR